MTRLVFIDTECDGLHPERRIWDLGIIERTPAGDVEHQWFFRLRDWDGRDGGLVAADPIALRIGRYYERHPDPWDEEPWGWTAPSWHQVAAEVARMLHGALVVGAVPWFDTEALDRTLRAYGALPTWNHHLVDVEALAAGALGMPPPWSFDAVLAGFGLAQGTDRHSALGDARLVRDLYDKVTTGWGGAS